MIEALWYGLVVSLSFIGFLSVLYYILLHTYSTVKFGKIIVCLPDNLTKNELYNALYGLYLQNTLFGYRAIDDIVILINENDAVWVYEICGMSEQLNSFKCLTYDEFLKNLNQEE